MGIRTVFVSLLVVLFCCVSASTALSSDLDPFTGQAGELRIAGGTAHIPVVKEAAKQIMRHNGDIRITIAGGGSGAGIKQVGEGLIDIGNSGRKPTDNEIKTYGLSLYKWAIDGVAVIVHPTNPVKALTSDQLKVIFDGTLTNWSQLGGPDRAINVYTRDAESGTRKVFWKKALGKGAIVETAQFAVSNGAMKSAVAQNPYAVGYMSAGYVDDSVAAVALNGVVPSAENINSGVYPVSRGLYSNTRGEASGLARLFIDFLLSETGQKIVGEKGFIPVK